ncbi:hypothetical protein Tco_1159327 [Tanacetum coccineum]
MEQENKQQTALDIALVPIDDQVKISACNMRIDPLKNQKEPTYQLTLDIIKQYSCYNAFLITADFKIGVELFRKILWITPRVLNQEFVEPPPHDALVSFIKQLGYKGALELVSEMKVEGIRSLYDLFGFLTNTEVKIPKEGKGGKGKGLMGNKKPDKGVQQEKKKKDTTPRKKSSITADDNILPDLDEAIKLGKSISLTEVEEQEEEHQLHETHTRLITEKVADTAESEETEDDEVKPLIQRVTSIVIGREITKKPTEEALDHSKKLKGIETLFEATQYMSDMQTSSKSSKLVYRIQQQSKGSSGGYGIIPEVPNEPKDIFGSSSSSLSGSDDEVKYVSTDNETKADENKAEEGKDTEEQAKEEPPVDDQAGMEQAKGEQAKVKVPNLVVPNLSSSLTLSFAEYDNQFINENPDVSITNILKDTTKIEIQSMVEVPIHQEDPVVQRTLLVDIDILMIPKKLSELEKKVKVLSKVNHAKAIEESVQANAINEVKNQLPKLLPKAVSDFVQPEWKEQFMGEIDPTKVLKKRRHDDKDKDLSADAEKGKKKRRRKDSKPSKDKEIAGSLKKGKAPSQPSTIDKTVNADETIHEAAMEIEEPVADNVINVEEQTQDDAAPKRDTSIWFKQDVIVRPETLDPE